MRALITSIIAVLLLCLSAAVSAGPLDDATAAWKAKDYATLSRILRPLAEQGEAWAQYNLGLMYDNGDGVPQDYAAALRWYRKAADQGFSLAQYSLGLMYFHGQGVRQDYAVAVGWYRKAAEKGLALAQNNLGTMYFNGQGVRQDYVQAHKWFNLAVSRYAASESEPRVRAVKNRDVVAAKMTPAQIAEAQKLARIVEEQRLGAPAYETVLAEAQKLGTPDYEIVLAIAQKLARIAEVQRLGAPDYETVLAIRNAKSTYQIEDGKPVLVVQGEVVNISTALQTVPKLRASLLENGHEVQADIFQAAQSRLLPGEVASFVTRFKDSSPSATELTVAFTDKP